MKYALVVPTNRMVYSIESYIENFLKYGHDLKDIKIIIVDDYSPYRNQCHKLTTKVSRKYSIVCEYWDIQMQKNFFMKEFHKRWKDLWSVIPHKTDACRSFGYLIAAKWGADIIITFDDDNWPLNNQKMLKYDFLGAHRIINHYIKSISISSDKKFINTCHFLKKKPSSSYIYARGYPYFRRGERYLISKSEGYVAMNAGLWLGNPDVDSITILNEGSMNGIPTTKTVGLKQYSRFIIAPGNMAPINTANTAYSKKILPCIYDTFQGFDINGLRLDRFGDIWCNLFIKKIIDRVGDLVTFGIPLVEHRREPRNIFTDLKKELWGLIITERLVNVVEKMELESRTYYDCYSELIYKLQSNIHNLSGSNHSIKRYFELLCKMMYKWVQLVDKLELL